MAATISAIVALAVAWGAAGAMADGDPASDVLVTQNVFVPYELSITRQTETLNALLAESARSGFPIRVALIAAPTDLGTVTSLWRDPVGYSRYLGTELSLAFHGQVAVVMPDGIGVWPGGVAPTRSEEAVAGRLRAPGGGAGLVTGAIAAVQRLAAAQGHPLSLAGVHVEAPVAPSGSSHLIEWLVFGIGAVLIAVCWGLSFRARPLDLRRRAAA